MKNRHIVLDVETGGLNNLKHPITQLALQVINNENLKILSTYDTFVKPYYISEAGGKLGYEITAEALKRTQVTMTQINGGILYSVLIKKLIEIFTENTNRGGRFSYKPILVGHNITFDTGMLEILFALFNKDLYDYIEKYVVDTMYEMQRLEGHIRSKEDKVKFDLVNCCERMGIKLKGAHGAPADVAATGKLFIAITKRMQNKQNGEEGEEAAESEKRFFEF